jgi:uncharacterized membrane protein
MESSTKAGSTERGRALTVHDDGPTVRRSVTVRKPIAEVMAAWTAAKVPGDVSFAVAPGDMGTEVHVTAPRSEQSAFKEITGALMHDDPGESLSTRLRQFRARLETGEIPTTHGQPSGREKQDHQ